MIADPPSEAGAVQLRVAVALPAVADPIVGAPGAVPAGVTGAGSAVTGLDSADSGPAPNMFTAAAWKVYVVPATSPVMVRLVAPAAAGCRTPT